MEINKAKFEAVVKEAKAKAADNGRWIRAIERAAAALMNGELIVTTLSDSHALVTSANGSYWVNGSCQCKAAKADHKECYHRAAARLMEIYEATPEPKPARPASAPRVPRIIRSVERDYTGARIQVVRVDGWVV
jgi:hypothetical protein